MATKQSNDQKPVANGQQHHEASGHYEDSSRENSSPDGSPISNSVSSVESPDSDVQNSRLAELAAQYGYQIIKENGQRKFYAPAEWNLPPPPRGSEVFIGKLPRDIYEDELFPLFARCGRIYEMRLMMDFSGTNRGYAFVTYTNAENARRACMELNNYEIRRGRHIGVVLSVDNCRLFVGGIPRTRTGEEVKAEMSKLTEGVVNVILYPSAADKTKNRGFAFVEYESHRAAAKARRKLLPNRIQLWGSVIAVDWAEPEQEVDETIMANVKVLYVRNLMVHTTEDTLRQAFEQATGTAGCIERVKKMRDFAFIHFSNRDQALRARDKMNGATLDGAIIEVVLSKPPYQSNIVRCMKNLQKSGGGRAQSVTSNGTDEYIATAVRQMYAATNPALVSNILASPTNSLTSPTTPINPMAIQPSHPVYLSQTAAAYTGFPCIDLSSTTANLLERQNSLGGQGNGAAKFIGGAVQANSNSARANRGAAGMRSAGFQAMINNTLRHTATSRRKTSEQFLYECLLNQQQQIPMPVQQQPLGTPQQPMATPPGLFIIPNAPLWRPAVTAAAGSYVSFLPSPSFTVVPTSAPAPMPVVSDPVSVSASVAIPAPTSAAITTAANSTDDSAQAAAAQQVQQVTQTTPVLPSPILCIGNNGALSFPGCQQILSDFCRDHGLVIPQYERIDMHQKDSAGRDVTMFSFKICIPPLINTQGSYTINELEARESAAQAALSQLTMGMNQPMMSPGFDMFGYPMTQTSPFIFPDMNSLFTFNPLFHQQMRRPINQQLSVNAATNSPPTAV